MRSQRFYGHVFLYLGFHEFKEIPTIVQKFMHSYSTSMWVQEEVMVWEIPLNCWPLLKTKAAREKFYFPEPAEKPY